MVFAAPNPSPSHDSKDFDKCMNKLEEEIAAVAKKNQKQCEEQARAQNEFDATSPKAKFAAQLAEAVHSNAVDARSAVGQRFKRSLTPQEQHAYTQLSDDAARAEFRVKWASRSLETLKVTKTHLQSFQRVDERAVRDVRKNPIANSGSLQLRMQPLLAPEILYFVCPSRRAAPRGFDVGPSPAISGAAQGGNGPAQLGEAAARAHQLSWAWRQTNACRSGPRQTVQARHWTLRRKRVPDGPLSSEPKAKEKTPFDIASASVEKVESEARGHHGEGPGARADGGWRCKVVMGAGCGEHWDGVLCAATLATRV